MKKLLMFLVLMVAGCVAFVSCDDDTVELDEMTKQTIIMFCPWSGDRMHSAILNNIDSIESGIKSKNGLGTTRLLVFLSESSHSSKLFEIIYENKTFERKTIAEYSDRPYTTVQGISDLINKVKETAPAWNYAMIIGGHGTGWTNIGDWEDYPYRIKRRTLPIEDETRFFGSVEDKNYAIDVETLAEGIANSDTKMQYILFDDCYMANVEVAYSLRKVTNFLVASTSEVMAIGMPYATMWANLASLSPNYSGIVSSFDKFYSNYRMPYGTLSAIDCRQVEELAGIMKQINAHYQLADTLIDSLQTLDGFVPSIFYDMGDYVKQVCKDPNLYNKFSTKFSKVVPNSVHTDSIYSVVYGFKSFKKLKTFSGLTITDPSLHSVALKGKEMTGWWKATHDNVPQQP